MYSAEIMLKRLINIKLFKYKSISKNILLPNVKLKIFVIICKNLRLVVIQILQSTNGFFFYKCCSFFLSGLLEAFKAHRRINILFPFFKKMFTRSKSLKLNTKNNLKKKLRLLVPITQTGQIKRLTDPQLLTPGVYIVMSLEFFGGEEEAAEQMYKKPIWAKPLKPLLESLYAMFY
ncbi:hypothetical protein AGLY_011763 [Aphis glycines]|uniref:Uncharacterized protein n=1 Tax=Aphis glycines TaxID=307491 RepID=A0A6G0TCF8_APHGL|nr:hypothetical protein AGLY_011763 [Aphis glycines]